jgi:3-hydroxyacyl-CoA dehydrogenase/3-hydroxy-2-methylbutyryl-CoA dehydrogenase
MPLSKYVSFITGANQGLGRATALKLASLNSKVVLTDTADVTELARMIGLDKAFPIIMDVTNEDQVKFAMQETVKKWGKLTTCINCAGISPPMKTLGKKGVHSLDLFSKVLLVNAVGTFNVCRLAAEVMSLNGEDEDGLKGLIINTASIAAYEGI